MYVTVTFPTRETAEIQLFRTDTMRILKQKIIREAPAGFQHDDLFRRFSAFCVRGGEANIIDTTSDTLSIAGQIEDEDTIDIRPGALRATERGRPVQIVNFVQNDKGSSFEIDENVLEDVLGAQDIRTLPCVVVSLAGPFRTGKSFMLNFFLRYLSDPENWMVDEDKPVEGGFPWKHGVNRDTTGIWMWSKPFVRTLPSGEEVAVLLIDTQGTFDNHTTMAENTRVFALNALISSMQIYNIKEKISEDIIQHMHLFTEFGAMIGKEFGEGKPFQNLEFLIRDWEFDTFDAGEKGGNAYLKTVLAVSDNQAEELRGPRQWLKECYEHMSCYLLPDPGKKVKKSTFEGQLSELENDFRRQLEAFVPHVLADDALIVKRMGEERVTCHNLIAYITAFSNAFNCDELPKVETIFEATARVNRENVKAAAFELYELEMNRVAGPGQPFVGPDLLVEAHNKSFRAAMDFAAGSHVLGGQRAKQDQQVQLEEQIKSRFQEYKAFNGSKDILKGLRTPFAFALSAFVLHILSVVLDVVELDMIAGWLNYVAWISALLVALWGFLNYSGNAPGIVQQLDQGGSYLWDMFKDLLHVYIHQTQGTPLARHKKTQ